MSLEIAKIGLNGIATAIALARANKAHSLSDYGKATRVQPRCLVSADMVDQAVTSDIMQVLLSTVIGYYLQAVAVSTNVGRINVLDKLERLNPNRDSLSDVAFWDSALGLESYSNKLPDYSRELPKLAMEADAKSMDAMVRDVANLGVGKLVGVEIQDNGQKFTIPVSFRLKVQVLPDSEVAHILSLGGKDTSWKGRMRQINSGELDWWRDGILCQDLITAHRRNLMKDKSGVYTDVTHRQRNNGIMGVLDMKPSLGTISNLYVISRDVQTQLELQINGSLDNPRVRNNIFENTAIMILAVYDKNYDRVMLYHHGISDSSELGAKDLKNAAKGDGPNITDILKAYTGGLAPAF